MSEKAIVVKGLSKRYRIGLEEKKQETFGSQLWYWIGYPIRNFRNLVKLSTFRKIEDGRDIHWALKGLNFEVEKGQVLGIIGKNGAGKSTLLKVLSRITSPTEGEIRIRGKVSSLLEVGTGFHPDLTGRDNIYMNGTILGMTKKEIDGKLERIIDFSGIRKYVDTPVKRYSSGMKVRLAFSVAAHLDPEILIIDEVLAVGDAEFQKKCLGKLQDESIKGRTVLFVSHNMEAVQNLCDRVIILKEGEMVFDGSPEDSIKTYLREYINTNHVKKWDFEAAPGNDKAKLLGSELIFTEANRNFFFTNEQIEFRFRVWSNIESGRIDLTYHLRDELGILVLVESTGFISDEQIGNGYSIISSSIPKNILNQGTYTIDMALLVLNRGTVLAKAKDLLTFEILPLKSDELGWVAKKEGVLKLRDTAWKINKEESTDIREIN